MKSYFIVFKRQKGQETDAFMTVTEDQLKKIEKKGWPIKWKKEIPTQEIYTKEELKAWMHELGGVWYGDNK